MIMENIGKPQEKLNIYHKNWRLYISVCLITCLWYNNTLRLHTWLDLVTKPVNREDN